MPLIHSSFEQIFNILIENNFSHAENMTIKINLVPQGYLLCTLCTHSLINASKTLPNGQRFRAVLTPVLRSMQIISPSHSLKVLDGVLPIHSCLSTHLFIDL